MSKPEFMAWVRPELMRFWHEHRGESASIDRTGLHYEIGSIRVVSKRVNSGKTSKSRIRSFREFVEIWFWIKRSYKKDIEIARLFGLSPQTVGRIRAGKTYREYIEKINRGEHRPKMIRLDAKHAQTAQNQEFSGAS
ncbi:hypothetical protein [Anatilimnocola aggregata]|nr:hypothetical protein [Anatilimnocola aggregata]